MRAIHVAYLVPLTLLLGCQGNRAEAPTGPDAAPESPALPAAALDPGVHYETGGLALGTGVASVYDLTLSLAGTPEARLEPLRTGEALADRYDVDITAFLRGNPCGDCLKVTGLGLADENTVQVTFELQHPFQSLATRKDLHVFDVRGHLVSGSDLRGFDNVLVDVGGGPEPVRLNPALLRNADGYSSFYDGVVESFLGINVGGNTRPYKFFWRDLSNGTVDPLRPTGFDDVDNPFGHSVFPQGGKGTDPRAEVTYDIGFTPGGGDLNFLFVVDAAYGVSAATRPDRMTPKYFIPLFNQPEAVVMTAALSGGPLREGDTGTSVTLDFSVGDWQAGKTVPPGGFDPTTASLDDIAFASDLEEVIIDVPGVLDEPIVLSRSNAISGTGIPSDPYDFQIALPNEQGAEAGLYYGLIVAVDEAASGEGPTPLQRDGLTTDTWSDFRTYQTFPVEVFGTGNIPPVAELEADDYTPDAMQPVFFQPTANTTDPDGAIVTYEYDFDYDSAVPGDFTPDLTRSDPNPVIQAFPNPGAEDLTVEVALRVTDDGAPALTDVHFVTLTVTGELANQPPVAVIEADNLSPRTGQMVNFQPGLGTTDPDGTIVLYEYDFNYDPAVPGDFDIDDSNTDGSPVSSVFTNPGSDPIEVSVAMRVTDDGVPAGLTAVDYVTLVIRTGPDPNALAWDFENEDDDLGFLGFSLLGNNGFEHGPVSPCETDQDYGEGVIYDAPPPGSTWGLVSGIGDPAYPDGATTNRALEESGSTAPPGTDNRYYTDTMQAIRSPLMNLPAGDLTLEMHHWFQADLDYHVGGYLAGGFPVPPAPIPGRTFFNDGGTVWIREAPGGVPAPTATRLDVVAPEQAEPQWQTFTNSIGQEITLDLDCFCWLLEFVDDWLLTNYEAGVDEGFAGVSYNSSVADRRPVVERPIDGGWGLNPVAPTFMDSHFDLSPWAGQQVFIEFRWSAKSSTNPGCRDQPGGPLGPIGPPCLRCAQNLESLVTTSPNFRRSKGWKIDSFGVVVE